MKKLFYILLLALASGITFTSCTEEEIAPVEESGNGGGAGSVDPYK